VTSSLAPLLALLRGGEVVAPSHRLLVSLCGVGAPGSQEKALPPLQAFVTDFPQEHLDPDPVEGCAAKP